MGARRVRRASRLKLLTTGWLAAGLVLAGVELALRIAGEPPATWLPERTQAPGYAHVGWHQTPSQPVTDENLTRWNTLWGLPPDPDPGTINRYGMRDNELADPKPPGQKRVLVIGDSSAWGSGCPMAERFSSRLEVDLNPPDGGTPETRGVEVMNAAVPGYSSYQALLSLEDLVDASVVPDGVVAYLMNSDFMHIEGGADGAYFETRLAAGGLAEGVERLATFRWVRALIWRVDPPLHPSDEVRVTVPQFQHNIERLVTATRRIGAWLVLVLPPQPSDLTSPDRVDGYQIHSPADVDEAATVALSRPPIPYPYRVATCVEAWKASVPVVDGPRIFIDEIRRSGPAEGANALFVDGIHPSSRGHALLADALLPVVRERLAQSLP